MDQRFSRRLLRGIYQLRKGSVCFPIRWRHSEPDFDRVILITRDCEGMD